MNRSCPLHLKDTSRFAWKTPALAAVIMAALIGGAQAQERLQAVRLKEIKDLDRLDPDWIMGICNLPGLESTRSRSRSSTSARRQRAPNIMP